MSLYQLFDQFCMDFCEAWGLMHSCFFDSTSVAPRQMWTLATLGIMLSIGLHLYHAIFELLTALLEWLHKKIKFRFFKSR